MALNARTMRAPGNSSADAKPAPLSRAQSATAPSRFGKGLQASITSFALDQVQPDLCRPPATRHTERQPEARRQKQLHRVACQHVHRHRDSAASDWSCSMWREENMTSCPAFTQVVPSALPTLPEPMMPIFVFSAELAENGTAVAAARATPAITRNLRRFWFMSTPQSY